MRTVCVQFKIGRTSGVSEASVATLMLRVAERVAARVFTVQRPSGRRYVNFLFVSTTPERTWQLIQRVAFGHRRVGRRLRDSTIITVEGTRSWDNYRILHHFNPRKSDPRSSTRPPRRTAK
jgi:hypothetical protein